MGTFLRRCVEVCRAIELWFGVMSGVGPGIHVFFNGRHDVLIADQLVCEKLTIFPYVDYILNSLSNWLSYDIVRFKIEVGVDTKCTRM